MDYSIVSADSHVFEPPDLWTTRIDAKFRDRAPRIIREKDGDTFITPKELPKPLGSVDILRFSLKLYS